MFSVAPFWTHKEAEKQVMDIVDTLFVEMFDKLNQNSKKRVGSSREAVSFQALEILAYGTEFYILHRYPLAVRLFYTMPCYGVYSNSFDVFIRGEKIILGSQRVHVPELLESHAKECGINAQTILEYIDFFRYATPPHGGFGAGLEHDVMLLCGQSCLKSDLNSQPLG
ncbi:aspartate--tRNA ligase 2, cytoplasmic-like protein [Tanacetum coccineum]